MCRASSNNPSKLVTDSKSMIDDRQGVVKDRRWKFFWSIVKLLDDKKNNRNY
jgi:hypothetical protein